jgi:hypothetical protein
MRSLLVFLTIAIASSLAVAETTATTKIAQIMVLEPGDSSYKLFHGAVWLDYDKASTNYRWGGLECKGRDLSDTSIQLLFASFHSEFEVTVEYVTAEYKSKQYRCLTGFTIKRS